MQDTIISLGFLILGGGFVVSLLRALMQMLGGSVNASSDKTLKTSLLGTFKLTIIFAVLLGLFVFLYVVPNSQ